MAVLSRNYMVSFSAFNRTNGTISVNQMPCTVNGLINAELITAVGQRVGQEWFLQCMQEDHTNDHLPYQDPTALVPDMSALDNYQFMVTGMVMLECDEDGKPYSYIQLD